VSVFYRQLCLIYLVCPAKLTTVKFNYLINGNSFNLVAITSAVVIHDTLLFFSDEKKKTNGINLLDRFARTQH
jgi:hypothetical protein